MRDDRPVTAIEEQNLKLATTTMVDSEDSGKTNYFWWRAKKENAGINLGEEWRASEVEQHDDDDRN